MMFKKTVLALAAFASAATASAQSVDSVVTTEVKNADKYRVETNRFGSNWFAGFGVGGNVYFGDHDKQMDFMDRLGLTGEVYFGKWFTPGIGGRIGFAYGKTYGISAWTAHQANNPNNSQGGPNMNWNNYQGFVTDKVYTTKPYTYYETKMDYVHAHADVLFNLSQMIAGYKPNRFYSFIPYVGVGFVHSTKRAVSSNQFSHEVTASVGLLNRFRISKRLDANLDIRGTYVGEHFDQETVGRNQYGQLVSSATGRYGEGIAAVYLGLSYNFGKTDWDRSTVTTVRVNEIALNNLRAENDALRAELERCLDRNVTAENVDMMPLLVTFPIDRWVLSNKDRVNLGFLADVLKRNPNMKYHVIGYADEPTATVQRNLFLSRKRSEVVFNCLVNEFGVSESQLIRESKGGVGNMYYNDPRCSRSVLLKISK